MAMKPGQDTFHRMLMAYCKGCRKDKTCDIYRTAPICEQCWPKRETIASAADRPPAPTRGRGSRR